MSDPCKDSIVDALNTSKDPVARGLVKLLNDVGELKETSLELRLAVAGNKALRIKGLVHLHEDHEKRISRMEKGVIWASGIWFMAVFVWEMMREKISKLIFPCIVILWILFITSCASHTETLNAVNAKKQAAAQIYVAATGDAIGEIDEDSAAVQAATDLNRDAQSVVGLPPPGRRLNAKGIIAGDKAARRQLADDERESNESIESARAEESVLLRLGSQKESENHKSLLRRVWGWTVGTLGIGGTIALCVLFPPAIPIVMSVVGAVFGWLVKAVPSLVGMLGVVGKSTFDNVVKGVGDARLHFQDAAAKNPAKTYTAAEVQEIINRSLAVSTDKADKSVIDISRSKQGV